MYAESRSSLISLVFLSRTPDILHVILLRRIFGYFSGYLSACIPETNKQASHLACILRLGLPTNRVARLEAQQYRVPSDEPTNHSAVRRRLSARSCRRVGEGDLSRAWSELRPVSRITYRPFQKVARYAVWSLDSTCPPMRHNSTFGKDRNLSIWLAGFPL
jgi:hypothetical protein